MPDLLPLQIRAQREVEGRIKEMSWGDLRVSGGATQYNVQTREFITPAEAVEIERAATLLKAVSLEAGTWRSTPVSYLGGTVSNRQIAGVSTAYFASKGFRVARGRIGLCPAAKGPAGLGALYWLVTRTQ